MSEPALLEGDVCSHHEIERVLFPRTALDDAPSAEERLGSQRAAQLPTAWPPPGILASATMRAFFRLVTAFGMTAALGQLAASLEWIRWFGVIYLVYLGVKEWRTDPTDLRATGPQAGSAKVIFSRGFLVSLTNPKTLIFYGAFFPQFLNAKSEIGGQLGLLSATFLVLAVGLDSGWAALAGRARVLLSSGGRLRTRLTGGFLIGAALGLALAHRR